MEVDYEDVKQVSVVATLFDIRVQRLSVFYATTTSLGL